jgi:hypothetical protein
VPPQALANAGTTATPDQQTPRIIQLPFMTLTRHAAERLPDFVRGHVNRFLSANGEVIACTTSMIDHSIAEDPWIRSAATDS